MCYILHGDNMKENFEVLLDSFKSISANGWIKGVTNHYNSIGTTFEKELGKKADSMYFPDYYGIELKCTGRFSRYPIYLFSVAFDGPNFNEINVIVNKYGRPDVDFPNKKVLFTKLLFKTPISISKDYKFKLEFDSKYEKMYLVVYDDKNMLIEKSSFVYVDSIKNHLLTKLQKLAIIYASRKKIDDNLYYRYYKLEAYVLKSFDTFINLLENDYIDISLISRISKSGPDKGRYRNKNIEFMIKKDKVFKLFDRVLMYDIDSEGITYYKNRDK